ncbi:putative serine hydrolase NDAI_0K00970 [Naumovozyma dairenensis CBS 421]|uniref:Serine hydrolase domain-containing protein n=1 Tax=Naumovozyma dairenensis (strain ATCC 10597 / BCRC 20456 / CBS 421 / NBRC 0211 / NRRL Y-12639) TaxID=1071378 RepID=G0WHM7_NAUDC|nr:hypothetical protein NDAI_0K00970 [Naumovozyma dairenensis CBS 421]CCD27288.1 hypothetical protein NDAI_0K00970 [Naumovozyma dairenensis CBS 421]
MAKKILMLHGLAQSGEYFASKTRGFRTELEKQGYQLCYATAPNKYPAPDFDINLDDLDGTSLPSESNEILAWLQKNPSDDTYKLPDTTISYLHDYIIANGPFHGIVGFSQGAGVAGYLLTDFNGLLHLNETEQPPLEFFMSFGGFRFKPGCYQKQYDENPIKVPSLHVYGDLDTITEPEKVQSLLKSCTEGTATYLTHPGGHFVPNSRGFLKKVVTWLDSLNDQEQT